MVRKRSVIGSISVLLFGLLDKKTGRKDASSPGSWTSILTGSMNSVDEEVQMKLLRIDSSARTASVTRQLTARAAEEWKKNNPDGDVMVMAQNTRARRSRPSRR